MASDGTSCGGARIANRQSIGKLTLESCLRLCGGEKSRKEAISVEILKKFVDTFGGNNLTDLRFLVVCLTGFAGFLRIQELLKVQLKQIAFFEDNMKI